MTPPLWNTHRVTLVTGAALLAPVVVAVALRGAPFLTSLALSLGVGVVWSVLFAVMRKTRLNWHVLVNAVIFALLLPVSVPIWQMVIALSFGIVFGDLIFGERGRSFLNGAVVGLAFLLFSFPAPAATLPEPLVAIVAAGSGALLLVLGLLSWRVVVALGMSVVLIVLLLPSASHWQALFSASVILGLVFLIGDPVAGACTNLGRWLYGGLAGGLLVMLGISGSGLGSLSSVVFAALLASIFAPLLDQIAIQRNVRRRARRQMYDR